MKKDTKKSDFYFNEPVSKRHKDSVFRAVEQELLINKKGSSSKSWSSLWLSGAVTCVLCAVLYFQVINPVGQNADMDFAMNNNLIMELAALSPDEIQIVEDLDFIEALDKLSPEELEEIML